MVRCKQLRVQSAMALTLPEPQLVVVSKPDLHDNAGAVSDYLREHKFQLASARPAFTIWAKDR